MMKPITAHAWARHRLPVCRVIQYKMHLSADIALGVSALASPWLFGFADNARARNTRSRRAPSA